MRQVVCPECGKTFDGEYGLSYHRKNEHRFEPPPVPTQSVLGLRILRAAGILDIIAVAWVSSLLAYWLSISKLTGDVLPYEYLISFGGLSVAGGVAALRGKPWWLAYWGSFFAFFPLFFVADSLMSYGLIFAGSLASQLNGVALNITFPIAVILTVMSRTDWSKTGRAWIIVASLILMAFLVGLLVFLILTVYGI